jgi:hypothetical protein
VTSSAAPSQPSVLLVDDTPANLVVLREVLKPVVANLSTTLRYMHLSPAARSSAIGLLNSRPAKGASFGDIVEPRAGAESKS